MRIMEYLGACCGTRLGHRQDQPPATCRVASDDISEGKNVWAEVTKEAGTTPSMGSHHSAPSREMSEGPEMLPSDLSDSETEDEKAEPENPKEKELDEEKPKEKGPAEEKEKGPAEEKEKEPAGEKPTEKGPAEEKEKELAGEKPTEKGPAEEKEKELAGEEEKEPAEEKPAEEKPTEKEPAQEKPTEKEPDEKQNTSAVEEFKNMVSISSEGTF